MIQLYDASDSYCRLSRIFLERSISFFVYKYPYIHDCLSRSLIPIFGLVVTLLPVISYIILPILSLVLLLQLAMTSVIKCRLEVKVIMEKTFCWCFALKNKHSMTSARLSILYMNSMYLLLNLHCWEVLGYGLYGMARDNCVKKFFYHSL